MELVCPATTARKGIRHFSLFTARLFLFLFFFFIASRHLFEKIANLRGGSLCREMDSMVSRSRHLRLICKEAPRLICSRRVESAFLFLSNSVCMRYRRVLFWHVYNKFLYICAQTNRSTRITPDQLCFSSDCLRLELKALHSHMIEIYFGESLGDGQVDSFPFHYVALSSTLSDFTW